MQKTTSVKCIHEGDDEPTKSLGDSNDVTPLFERGKFERAFRNRHSMMRNERLHCRWQEYVRTIESRQFSPALLPDVRELHFYNYAIRYLPSESTRHQDHKLKLKPGPGVDHVRHMPIPQEALMKRGTTVKSDRPHKRDKMAGNSNTIINSLKVPKTRQSI